MLQNLKYLLAEKEFSIDWYPLTAIFLCLLFILGYQLASPIIFSDSDMWYHLSGGRYLFDTHKLPTTSFFSFITPEREYTPYYWGFQALIYGAYQLGDYYGLALFRGLLTFGIIYVIFLNIKAALNPNKQATLILLLLVLFAVLIDARSFQLRPHLMSYLFIASFVYILEFKQEKVKFLPLLSVLWANTHGVEYVIALLLLGTYGLQWLWNRYKPNPQGNEAQSSYFIWLVVSGLALLINPFGWHLLPTAFSHTDELRAYITELAPISLHHLTNWNIADLKIGYYQAFSFLFLLLIISVGMTYRSDRLPLRHIILLLAGAYLLTKGVRFTHETALLTLPVLLNRLRYLFDRHDGSFLIRSPFLSILLTGVLFISSLSAARDFRAFPFDNAGLPLGASNFLNQTDASGNILTDANLGGYLQWQLKNEIKIFQDMQTPPFTVEDMASGAAALESLEGLNNFNQSYQVDFVLLGRQQTHLQNSKNWRLVYIDEKFLLYSNALTQGDIGHTWGASKVDVTDLLNTDLPVKTAAELKKMLPFKPDSKRLNMALSQLSIRSRNYPAAMEYALVMPDSMEKAYLLGFAHYQLGDLELSTDLLKLSHRKANLNQRKFSGRMLGHLYAQFNQPEQALTYYNSSIKPHDNFMIITRRGDEIGENLLPLLDESLYLIEYAELLLSAGQVKLARSYAQQVHTLTEITSHKDRAKGILNREK